MAIPDTFAAPVSLQSSDQEMASTGMDVQGLDQSAADTVPESADAVDPAPTAAAFSSSTAGGYLELVQSQSDGQATTQPVDDHPSSAADYMQMVADVAQPAQEPPPPDHLYADAQIDHGGPSSAGVEDAQPDAAQGDATAAAMALPDPMPADQHQDHG
jgi:hypothetical protein